MLNSTLNNAEREKNTYSLLSYISETENTVLSFIPGPIFGFKEDV